MILQLSRNYLHVFMQLKCKIESTQLLWTNLFNTAQNLNKALNLNLILIELTEFRSDLSTCNILLDVLHHITCANLTPLITSGCLRESTMAKPVMTIVNSLRNIRIAYVPLLTAIGNAVGIFLSAIPCRQTHV